MSPDADPVEKLVGFDVLSADPGDDPALAPSFRAAWHETAETLADDPEALDRVAVTVTTGGHPRITVTGSDADGVVVGADGSWAGQWPLRMALIANLATERTPVGPAWDTLGHAERVDLATRIHGLVGQCPTCCGPTRVSDKTVESCCHTTAVIAVSRADCGDRLAKFDPSPPPFAPGL